jgi:hypothetical protein
MIQSDPEDIEQRRVRFHKIRMCSCYDSVGCKVYVQ